MDTFSFLFFLYKPLHHNNIVATASTSDSINNNIIAATNISDSTNDNNISTTSRNNAPDFLHYVRMIQQGLLANVPAKNKRLDARLSEALVYKKVRGSIGSDFLRNQEKDHFYQERVCLTKEQKRQYLRPCYTDHRRTMRIMFLPAG